MPLVLMLKIFTINLGETKASWENRSMISLEEKEFCKLGNVCISVQYIPN